MFDVPECAVGAEGTEAAGVVRTGREAQRRGGGDVQIGAVVALRADSEAGELLTLPLIAQIKGVRKLARLALLAQTPLVMFADQMADARSFFLGDVMAVGTCGTARAVAFDEVWAEGPGDFGGGAEGWEGGFEEGGEGEGGGAGGFGMEDVVGEGGWRRWW